MSKHTPGPWEVQRLNHAEGDLWLQIGHRREGRSVGPVCDLPPSGNGLVPPSWTPVAALKYLVTSPEEQEANALLIAAAPDLLRELEALASRIDRAYGAGFDTRQAFKAVNKAKGEGEEGGDK